MKSTTRTEKMKTISCDEVRRAERNRTWQQLRVLLLSIVGASLCLPWISAQSAPQAQNSSEFKTQKEKVSYALGMDLGNQLRKMSIDVDPSLFGQALKDALAGVKTLLTEGEVRDAISQLQAEMKRKESAKQRGDDESGVESELLTGYNKKAGDTFLAENKKKDGVVTLPSGLQYRILKAGDGKKPADEDTVTCQYRATLLNGSEFDSSYRTGHPASVVVKNAIPGWREALKLMAVGSRFQLFIPSELAYGAQGFRNIIGPNSTLTFDVELLTIQ
jgi:FKBP-type peptidyl-prolyl cis-trans isomerase FklB